MYVAKSTGCRALRDVAKAKGFARRVERWVNEMPETHRAEWLVDELALAWGARPADVSGPIVLPRVERDRLEKRLEQLWERTISTWDDEPDPEEYALLLENELMRIARKNETFAMRWLDKREILERDAHEIDSEADVLAFVERDLGVTWSGPKPVVHRTYSSNASYAAGEIIEHHAFGTGTVIEVLSDHMRVRFADRVRALLCSRVRS